MNLELIPILLFAWFVEFTKLIQANAILFFTPGLAIVWAVGIIAVMRRWESR